ncbi:MAG: ABC transporter permease [Chloroflexi bacterium]|nr:ABC transporter permease [Chloroflexota bacterium]
MDLESAPETTTKTSSEERIYVATQWQLMWYRFRRHKLALVGTVVAICLYLMALLSGFLAPYGSLERFAQHIYAPPQAVRFYADGKLQAPFVYALVPKPDPVTFRRIFEVDKTTRYPLRFFVHGIEYKLLGLIKTDLHLFGVDKGGTVFLLGTDILGRDVFTRILAGSVISLSIGLVGVFTSFILGCLLGGISGLYGGAIDVIIQRIIEFLTSIPTIPLWMALSAAVPKNWNAIQVYFAITIILSLRAWTGLGRVVRGKLLQVKEEDFVMAARLSGASDWRILLRHLLPATISYLIVEMTLAIPQMILGETSLSFLGLGLRPPVVSWGVLLQLAQNVRTVTMNPWLLAPAVWVILTVMAFNFMGDGMRDAADPYHR